MCITSKKQSFMKLVKLSVFALTMGLFLASCGNGGEAAKTATDSAAAAPAPAPEAPKPVDTMNAGAAKPADAAAAPAADAAKPAEGKMDAKKDAKMEEKKK